MNKILTKLGAALYDNKNRVPGIWKKCENAYESLEFAKYAIKHGPSLSVGLDDARVKFKTDFNLDKAAVEYVQKRVGFDARLSLLSHKDGEESASNPVINYLTEHRVKSLRGGKIPMEKFEEVAKEYVLALQKANAMLANRAKGEPDAMPNFVSNLLTEKEKHKERVKKSVIVDNITKAIGNQESFIMNDILGKKINKK